MRLELEQTDDASLQVRDQDAFCFIPVGSFDLEGHKEVLAAGTALQALCCLPC